MTTKTRKRSDNSRLRLHARIVSAFRIILPYFGLKLRRLGRGYKACLCFVSILKSIPSQDLWAGSPKVTPVER
jgi:hypothetical protein